MTSQILVFHQPRSGSHLLQRMLFETQSSVKLLPHHFNECRGTQLQWLRDPAYKDGMPNDSRATLDEEFQKSIDVWQTAFEEARDANQKLAVVMESFFPVSPERLLEYIEAAATEVAAQTGGANCTMIPDNLLLRPGTIPILTFRHPKLAVPSAYRVLKSMGIPSGGGRANLLITTCNVWNRMLYDFYVSHGITPLVLHADDYMTDESFTQHVCSRVGLDPAKAYLSWPAATRDEVDATHPMQYKSQSTLINSSGLLPSKAAKNVDLAAEEKGWKEESGEDEPLVREIIELAMPHYEYLFERRVVFQSE